jgi:hypothetical protein
MAMNFSPEDHSLAQENPKCFSHFNQIENDEFIAVLDLWQGQAGK